MIALRTFLLAGTATVVASSALAQVVAPPLRPDVAGPEQQPADIPQNEGGNLYAEIRGVVDLDSIGDDFRSYAQFSLGGDAFVRRNRLTAGVSGSMNYRLPVTGNGEDRFSINGIGRATFEAIDDTLFVDGSVYAALLNRDFQDGLIFDPSQTSDNLAQTYSLSISPRFERNFADIFRATGRYKFYYINVDESVGGTGGGGNVGGGSGGLGQTYSDSTGQYAEATLGTAPGTTRLSVTFLGSGTWDNQEQLEQEYRAYRGSADVGFALSTATTLLGSAGYEYYESTQQSILSTFLAYPEAPAFPDDGIPLVPSADDPNVYLLPDGTTVQPFAPAIPPAFLANGFTSTTDLSNPLLFVNPFTGGIIFTGQAINPDTGLFIPDPNAPRQTLYQDDGLVWNAGARYTPNSRFLGELRVGQRFGDLTITGQLSWRIKPTMTLTGRITDGLQTYGTLLTQTIDGVPVTYASGGGRRNGNIGGCVTGPDPGDPTGCIDGATEYITSGVFRNRLASLSLDLGNRSRRLNTTFAFTQRDYLDTNASTGPGAPPLDPTLPDRRDRSYRLDTSYSQDIGPGQEATGGIILGYYDRQLREGGSDFYLTGVGRYYGQISDQLSVVGSIAVTQRWGDDNTTNATLTGGLRYEF